MNSAENVKQLVKNAKIITNPEVKKAALAELIAELKKSKTTNSTTTKMTIGMTIMKSPLTKLASAAAIIIVVYLVLYVTNGADVTNVALGEVLKNVKTKKYFTYRHKVKSKTNAGTPEETSKETDRITYISTEYGLRHDVYEDGQLTGILYTPSTGLDITYVRPATKQYSIATMSEEYMKQETQVSPSGLIEEFMSHKYTNLGRKTIDGVEAEGIEINEPGFYGFKDAAVARLWIDIQTNLPLKMEIEGVRGATKTTVITYDYNWDAKLDPSIFQVNIPDDYTMFKEKVAIEGLKQCIEFFSSYITIDESKRPTLVVLSALEKSSTPAALRLKEDIVGLTEADKLKKVRSAGRSVIEFLRFYRGLVRHKQDPAYYGKTVGPKDVDKLLLRWKLNDGHYRVIFGDLKVKTVTVKELVELEKPLQAQAQKSQSVGLSMEGAILAGNMERVKELISQGADVNAKNARGMTPLHIVTRTRRLSSAERLSLIETLISAGADVNAKDVRRGRTSLHIAAWYTAEQNPKVIELLLSKGADINAKDNDGKTALAYAIEGGYTEIAEILRKHGAKE
jgi:hypothetical protein